MDNNFKMFYLTSGQFSCQILCLSYKSIYSYVDIMQAELKKQNIVNANILIDQLLITGNSKNRFLSIRINNGNICFNDATNITPDIIHRQFTSSFLQKQQNYLNSSILTRREISMLKKGCVL